MEELEMISINRASQSPNGKCSTRKKGKQLLEIVYCCSRVVAMRQQAQDAPSMAGKDQE